jgi:general secretion pathway protein L
MEPHLQRHPLIVLEKGLFQWRHLSEASLPYRRTRAMAEFDVLGATPFKRDDVVVLVPARTGRRSPGGYYIAKKARLLPLLQAFTSRARICSIRVADGGSEIEIEPASFAGLWQPPRSALIGRRLRQAACVFLVAALPVTFAHAKLRNRSAMQALDRKIEPAEAEAKKARLAMEARNRQREQVDALRQQKGAAVPLYRIWEELSKVIPDSAWLTDLSLDGRSVTATGFARSAPDLVGLIDKSPLFREPIFVSPVVKVPGADGDQFTIRMELEQGPA